MMNTSRIAMNVTFNCTACNQTARVDVPLGAVLRSCPHCAGSWDIPVDATSEDLVRCCLICSSRELFLRKDFPQRLGLTIVLFGLGISCVTWYFHMLYATYGVLFGTAMIDVLLFLLIGNVLTCYRCKAEYREVADSDHDAFDLEIHERHRQQDARVKNVR